MTKYEIAVRLLAEYCDCPSKDGTTVDLPMEWCENHCKYEGENADHVETLQCWEKVINDRYEAQSEMDKMEHREDVISRQAAIEAIQKLPNAGMRWFVSAEAGFDALLKLPSVQPEQRWIPVSERLPKAECGESDNVLTTCAYKDSAKGYRRVKTLYYNGGVWCHPTGEAFEGRVLAWMPMPAPFELQESEDKE